MSIVSGRATVFPRVVDIMPDIEAAFALRKVNTSYSGPIIRIRRGSDDAETDIGLLRGVLDTQAIAQFAGSDAVFVVRWYDQSLKTIESPKITGFTNDPTIDYTTRTDFGVVVDSQEWESSGWEVRFSNTGWSTSGFGYRQSGQILNKQNDDGAVVHNNFFPEQRPFWVHLTYPYPVQVEYYTMWSRAIAFSNTNGIRRPKNWTVEGSHDGVSWVILHTVTNGFATYIPYTEDLVHFDVTSPGFYKNYRLHVTANWGDASQLDIEQWNLFSSRVAYASTNQPLLALDSAVPRLEGGSMTSPGAPGANVVSVSESYAGPDTQGSVGFVNVSGTSIESTTETYMTTQPATLDAIVSKIQRSNAVSTPVVRTGGIPGTSPTVCYALSKKVPGYSGPLCRVRRVSDDVEVDVWGLTNTEFLDSGEMRVVRWYDQAGSNHAAAPTPDTQPRLLNTADGWVVDFDGTGFENRRYLELSAVAAQAVWSQFQVKVFNTNYATLFTYSAGNVAGGMRFQYGRFIESNGYHFLSPVGSQVSINGSVYTYPSDNPLADLDRWYRMLAYRNTSTQSIDRIGRTNWNTTYYRDFTGYVKEFFIYGSFDSSSLTSQAQALTQASTRNVARIGLPFASERVVDGFIQRSELSMEEICEFIVNSGIGTGLYSSNAPLNVIGGVYMDYYVHRGDLTVTDPNALFTTIKDVRPAFIVVDGDLTIPSTVTLTPPVRKLFFSIYCTGSLKNHGTISMTARGANHSGTGDSGGRVEPVDIKVDKQGRNVVPKFGGDGVKTSFNNQDGENAPPGGTGGGGQGGAGSTSEVRGGYGSQGTCFTGGTGGGSSVDASFGGDGEEFGGKGGDGISGFGKGAGNPVNGTGGTLCLFASILSGTGTIESKGQSGSIGNYGYGGGASGGGSIHVINQCISGKTNIDASGGSGDYKEGSVWNKRGGSGGDGSVTITTTPVVVDGLVGWWTGESWTGTQWTDLSGVGNHVTSITNTALTTDAVTLNGYPCLSGGTTDALVWPTAILPPTYTLFHVCTYNGSNKGRIMNGYDQNWLSGFWSGKQGVAHHNTWITRSSAGNVFAEWLLSSDQNALYRGNFIDFTIASPGSPSYARLAVNTSAAGTSEPSDFAIAEILVYDRTLSTQEIVDIESYLGTKYGLTGAEMGTETMRLDAPVGDTWPDSTLLAVPFLPMTADSSVIQNETFVASASSGSDPWQALDQSSTTYWTASSEYNADGTYAGSASTGALDDGVYTTYAGEWLQLQCPRALGVDSIRITTRADALTRGPEEYVILGSQDGSSWFLVLSVTGRSVWTTDGYTDYVADKTPYRHWRLVITKKINGGDPWGSIGEFGLFSRQSRRGTLVNAPTQKRTAAGQEYLEFNETNYCDIQLQNPAGAWAHTISFWMRLDAYTDVHNVFQFGSASTNKCTGLRFVSSQRLQWVFFSNDVQINNILSIIDLGRWCHVCLTYNGGATLADRQVYINNVPQTLSSVGDAFGQPNFDANMTGSVGRERARNQWYFPGAISQFRVYDGALSADQVNDIYRSGLPDHLLDHAVIALRMSDAVAADSRASSSSLWGEFSMIGSRAPSITDDSVSFDRATKQFLSIPSLNITQDFTVMVYAKVSSMDTVGQTFLSLAPYFHCGQHQGTSDSISCTLWNDDVSAVAQVATVQDWHVYAFRHRSNTLESWTDGSEVSSVTTTLTSMSTSTARIGRGLYTNLLDPLAWIEDPDNLGSGQIFNMQSSPTYQENADGSVQFDFPFSLQYNAFPVNTADGAGRRNVIQTIRVKPSTTYSITLLERKDGYIWGSDPGGIVRYGYFDWIEYNVSNTVVATYAYGVNATDRLWRLRKYQITTSASTSYVIVKYGGIFNDTVWVSPASSIVEGNVHYYGDYLDTGYFQGGMRGLLVWDRALSDEEMEVMSQWLRDS